MSGAATLPQSIINQAVTASPGATSFALTTAQRLERFMRRDFDPRSEESWSVADKLWRAALLTRDVARTSSEVQS